MCFSENHCSDYLSNHLICNAFENDYDDGIYLNGLLKTSENFPTQKSKRKRSRKNKVFEEKNIRSWKSEMLLGGCAFVIINELIKSTKKTSKILCDFRKSL